MNEEPRRTYYDELGVSARAGQKEVERAFWEFRAGRGAGDSRSGDMEAAEAAYLVLSEPARRRAYDRLIGIERHPAWEGRGDAVANVRKTYCRALALLKSRREADALVLMKTCVRLRPSEALYRSSLALLLARRKNGVKKGFRLGMEAYRQCPGDRGVVENVAAICDIAGLRKRAAAMRRSLGEAAGKASGTVSRTGGGGVP